MPAGIRKRTTPIGGVQQDHNEEHNTEHSTSQSDEPIRRQPGTRSREHRRPGDGPDAERAEQEAVAAGAEPEAPACDERQQTPQRTRRDEEQCRTEQDPPNNRRVTDVTAAGAKGGQEALGELGSDVRARPPERDHEAIDEKRPRVEGEDGTDPEMCDQNPGYRRSHGAGDIDVDGVELDSGRHGLTRDELGHEGLVGGRDEDRTRADHEREHQKQRRRDLPRDSERR